MSQECLLSICMPIYNRLDSFIYVFSKLFDQVRELSTNEVEIIVSVNPSDKTKETKDFLYKKKKEYDFTININDENIGGDNNILKAITNARGRFVWVVGDDDVILPGVVEKVLHTLMEHKDITWLFLPSARLNGFPEDESSYVIAINKGSVPAGIYQNGKEAVMNAHKKMDGQLLFSSANIYLRQAALDVVKTGRTAMPQLGATFASAARGNAFFEKDICVLAGGVIAWGNSAAYNYMIRYHDDLLSCVGRGYTEDEIEKLIRYRMCHSQLILWFIIYKEVMKKNKDGKTAFKFLFRIAPIQTILTLIFSPVIAVYLVIRHWYRNYVRKKMCVEYLKSENPDPLVVSRIRF